MADTPTTDAPEVRCKNCLYFQRHKDSEDGHIFYSCWAWQRGYPLVKGVHPEFSCDTFTLDQRVGSKWRDAK